MAITRKEEVLVVRRVVLCSGSGWQQSGGEGGAAGQLELDKSASARLLTVMVGKAGAVMVGKAGARVSPRPPSPKPPRG